MVRLLVDQAQLEIELSPVERALALRKDSIRIPREAIVQAQLTDDPWTWLRGVRSPGTHIPGAVAVGTWRGPAGTDFAVVRGRRLDGVVITLAEGQDFHRIILSTAHGLDLVEALHVSEAD